LEKDKGGGDLIAQNPLIKDGITKQIKQAKEKDKERKSE